jgi:hypothetical protein
MAGHAAGLVPVENDPEADIRARHVELENRCFVSAPQL